MMDAAEENLPPSPSSPTLPTTSALEISSDDPFDADGGCGCGDDDDEEDEFHDNDGNFNGQKVRGGSPPRSPPPLRRRHRRTAQQIHTLFSSLFTWGMVASSILSLLPFFNVVLTILELTDRWYFCAVPAALQLVEKVSVYILFRRIQIKPRDYDSLPHQSWSMRVPGDEDSDDDDDDIGHDHGHDNDDDGGEGRPAHGAAHSHPHSSTRYTYRNLRRRLCGWCSKIRFSVELLVLLFMSWMYLHYIPQFCEDFVNQLLVDVDGRPYTDFYHVGDYFATISIYSQICGVFYSSSALCGVVALCSYYLHSCSGAATDSNHSSNEAIAIASGRVFYYCCRGGTWLHFIRYIHGAGCVIAGAILIVSLQSAWTYLLHHSPPRNSNIGPYCDPMDTTECLLPFPSSFFTVEDKTTQTGRRVNIEREALRSMYKGRRNPKEPIRIINELDGFSTSAPILFYIEGLKEAVAAGAGTGTAAEVGVDTGTAGTGDNHKEDPFLVGPEEMELSVTAKSLTLLLDVDSQTLVHHFAEIDHLDYDERPLAIIQPSQSLHHNTRYAVLLINAPDVKNGGMLPESNHLRAILDNHGEEDVGVIGRGADEKDDNDDDRPKLPPSEIQRGKYYRDTVLPLLYQVAPWLDETSTTIQMLFDFRTMSVDNQLGDTLIVVSEAYNHAMQQRKKQEQETSSSSSSSSSPKMNLNVRMMDRYDNDRCVEKGESFGSVIHAEIDVPSFLSKRHERVNELNVEAAIRGEPVAMEPFKFMIVLPCSIASGTVPLRAIVDYGHGFLYSRQEIMNAQFLHTIGNTEGYIYVASNWRGMSIADVGLIVRAFISSPNLAQSIRDNIIQGYANKAVTQYFIKNGLLDMKWMTMFDGKPIPIIQDVPLRYMFHGISQGGILGSAYTSLIAPTGFIDGAILTSPGTPFAMIMSRSRIFPQYQRLLLMSLYHNRHIRIFISFLQMGVYDRIEVGGLLEAGQPTVKTLIQMGLGDATVPSLSTEMMARAYKASMYPSNPREVFGVPSNMTSESEVTTNACLTEIMYESEYNNLPTDNVVVVPNAVHACTRHDRLMEMQLVEFINTGSFLDICKMKEGTACVKDTSWC